MGLLCKPVGLDVAWICDSDEQRLARGAVAFPAATASPAWEDGLRADLDGVLLANDFDAHAPLAIRFLEHDVHVLSETAACVDAREATALAGAAAASRATYSFAENYVTHPHVRLIEHAVRGGEIGEPELLEAEYLHSLPPGALTALAGDPAHWRGRIGLTQYCTHTVSPILAVTGASPVEVSAWPVQTGDRPLAVVITIRLSSGALAVTKHGFLAGEPGSHWSWLSVRGTTGLAESIRSSGDAAWSVRVRREPWAGGEVATDEIRQPPELLLDGISVRRVDEGTARILSAFRATIEDRSPPLIGLGPAVEASLVGVAAADSLARGAAPVPAPSRSTPASPVRR